MSSYLAQLDEDQLAKQIQYLLDEGFVPAIEYVRLPIRTIITGPCGSYPCSKPGPWRTC